MYDNLTIQTYVNCAWHDAMDLTFTNTRNVAGNRCTAAYKSDYLGFFLDRMETTFEHAVSVNLPLTWEALDFDGFPPFIYDIIPAGAAKTSLLKRFHAEKPGGLDTDLFLLGHCTPSPIGHLRVKESMEVIAHAGPEAFARKQVVDLTNRFIEYAYESGAALGGATGAQGEAPKLVLVEGQDGALFADAMLDDARANRHWLVKFARNEGTETDKNILRAEYQYYQAIARLGLDSVSTVGLALEEAEKPSLWMPRFDRRVAGGVVERIPVESMYSLMNNTMPGSNLWHEDVLKRLIGLWERNGQAAEVEDLIFEYIRRDLLNRVLGNCDNHGRNTAFYRYQGRYALAPIYDLAPMVLDKEGLSRVTKWTTERAGEPVWKAVCSHFEQWANPAELYARIRGAAEQFRALPDLLINLPHEIRQSDAIPVNNLDVHLGYWGLR